MILPYLVFLTMVLQPLQVNELPPPPSISSYVWYAQSLATDHDQYISFCKEEGVSVLYVQYNPHVDLEIYSQFIGRAHLENIRVQLLDGAPDWSTESGKIKLDEDLNWLKTYQASVKENEQFDGLHLDVEFYLLDPPLDKDHRTIESYMALIDRANGFCEDNQLTLSCSVPFWLEEIKLDDTWPYKNLAEWHVHHVPYTVVMAYRNITFGPNSISRLVRDELEYAKASGNQVIIGLETSPSEEGDHISFNHLTKRDLERTLSTLNIFFSQNDAFGGFAIHHLPSWIKLYASDS